MVNNLDAKYCTPNHRKCRIKRVICKCVDLWQLKFLNINRNYHTLVSIRILQKKLGTDAGKH